MGALHWRSVGGQIDDLNATAAIRRNFLTILQYFTVFGERAAFNRSLTKNNNTNNFFKTAGLILTSGFFQRPP